MKNSLLQLLALSSMLVSVASAADAASAKPVEKATFGQSG